MSNKVAFKTIKELPQPKGHPLFGHLPQFKANSKHAVLARWAKECGDLFQIRFLTKKFIVSTNPEFNHEVLKARPIEFRRFSKIEEIFNEIGIYGVFNAEGDIWKKHRKPAVEALSAKNIKGYYSVIADKSDQLLQKINQYALNNTPVDVQQEFMRFTIDVTTEVAFGYKVNTVHNPQNTFQQHLEQIFPMINQRMAAPIPLWRFYKKQKDRDLEKALKKIEEIIYQFIDKAQKKRAQQSIAAQQIPANFLEALLIESEKENFSEQEIFGNVFTLLLAGEDTTSNSISWAFYYLAQQPDLVNKIREEANTVYRENTVINYADIAALKWANAAAKEALRLKPTTPQLFMQANQKSNILGLEIKKGQTVILQNMVAPLSNQYFTEPDKFKAERWLKEQCPFGYAHSPEIIRAFGGGARFCPGMRLAMTEMTAVISTLCKNFDFMLANPADKVTEEFAFTMYPGNLKIKFSPVGKRVEEKIPQN